MQPLNLIKSSNQTDRINRAATKALKTLKEEPQMEQVHSLQLMEWAIQNGMMMSNETLDATILRLQITKPQVTMKILEEMPSKLPSDPKELAMTLIQTLEDWINYG